MNFGDAIKYQSANGMKEWRNFSLESKFNDQSNKNRQNKTTKSNCETMSIKMNRQRCRDTQKRISRPPPSSISCPKEPKMIQTVSHPPIRFIMSKLNGA